MASPQASSDLIACSRTEDNPHFPLSKKSKRSQLMRLFKIPHTSLILPLALATLGPKTAFAEGNIQRVNHIIVLIIAPWAQSLLPETCHCAAVFAIPVGFICRW
jgi:hypothetical protein